MERFRFRSLKQGWKEETNEYNETYYRLYDFEKNNSIYDEIEMDDNNILRSFLDPLVLNNNITRRDVGDSFLFFVFNHLNVLENESGKVLYIQDNDEKIITEANNAIDLLHNVFDVLYIMIKEINILFSCNKKMSNLFANILEILSENHFIDYIDILEPSVANINSLIGKPSKDMFRLGPYERSFKICSKNYISLSRY